MGRWLATRQTINFDADPLLLSVPDSEGYKSNVTFEDARAVHMTRAITDLIQH